MLGVSEYIKQLQGFEEYGFSWQELIKNCDAPLSTLRKELLRLSAQNDIFNLRNGYYLILPPRYQAFGKLPIQLYIQKLFTDLDKPYYVGLYSASAIHGASHQRIQQDYVITVSPAIRDIKKGSTNIRFFSAEHWPNLNILQHKSDAGIFNVSSPALTAVDLIHHHTKLGGINRMLSNLDELSREITPEDLADLLTWYPYQRTLQRFGFLMEQLAEDTSISDRIFERLAQGRFYHTVLSAQNEKNHIITKNRWKVDVNLKLENDL